MAFATIDGIATRYEVLGSGPPLLLYAPGGFDATVEKWTTLGIYKEIRFLDHLPRHFTCIAFDRREAGRSGGRVERITWAHYARQGKGLLEHLGLEHAHVMGGCMGANITAAFADRYAALNVEDYRPVVAGMARALLDRDTAPGAEPEDLLRLKVPTLIVPGSDASHATSAARYLAECIPGAEYWDVPVAEQKPDVTNARVLAFLDQVGN